MGQGADEQQLYSGSSRTDEGGTVGPCDRVPHQPEAYRQCKQCEAEIHLHSALAAVNE
jgi:hypothetical protein